MGADSDTHGLPLRTLDPVEPRQFNPQHLLVEKQQRRQRLVLRGSSDVTLDREVREERCDLRRPQLARVSLAVKQDEASKPADVGLLSAVAIVLEAQSLAHLV